MSTYQGGRGLAAKGIPGPSRRTVAARKSLSTGNAKSRRRARRAAVARPRMLLCPKGHRLGRFTPEMFRAALASFGVACKNCHPTYVAKPNDLARDLRDLASVSA